MRRPTRKWNRREFPASTAWIFCHRVVCGMQCDLQFMEMQRDSVVTKSRQLMWSYFIVTDCGTADGERQTQFSGNLEQMASDGGGKCKWTWQWSTYAHIPSDSGQGRSPLAEKLLRLVNGNSWVRKTKFFMMMARRRFASRKTQRKQDWSWCWCCGLKELESIS